MCRCADVQLGGFNQHLNIGWRGLERVVEVGLVVLIKN